MQCAVAAGLVDVGGSDEWCRPFFPSRLSLPTPLRPLPLLLPPSSSHHHYHGFLVGSPLFLYAISLLALSLFASHKLSKTPIRHLGCVGVRGRRHFSWNEAITGDCGNGICDWWIFGGSVWIRAFLGLRDMMMISGLGVLGGEEEEEEEGGEHESDDSGGENIFACFGIIAKVDAAGSPGGRCKSSERPRGSHVGILGYDTILGAHGPLVLAPLRASVLVLAWLSVCSFMAMTHEELVRWVTNVDQMSTTSYGRKNITVLALHTIRGIQSIMNTGKGFFDDAHSNVLLPTIVYASVVIATAELSLYALGMVLTKLRLYVPQGVSNPGGPRPRKILRMPKWKEGKIHFLPRNLLSGDDGDANGRQWRCAVAHDAHRDTDSKFGRTLSQHLNEVSGLTGEPFGRQIWTTMVAQPLTRKGETEDDLEAMLMKEFPITPAKMQNKESYTAEGKSGQIKTEIFNQPAVISSFLQNFLSPDKQPQSKVQQSDQAKDDRNKLIQVLSSGGRSPLAFDPSRNPNSCDQLFRAQMIASYLEKSKGALPDDISYLLVNKPEGDADKNLPKSAMETARRGIAFYSMLQTSDGHFAGDYGGPHFLLPGLVVAWYVMGRPSEMISPSQQALMLHYLMVHQQEDGGWGTHIESPSTMFGTVICYLAVRLLGGNEDEDWITKGREFIQKEGGAVMTSSWAKFWLCLVGCMDWKGHNSVPPEMWLLPNWFPFHPGRLWCHCRMVYLPMGYLYGSRFIYSRAETDPLIKELRKELYCEPYDSVQWDSTRHLVADMDNYSPIPVFMKFAQNCLSFYENWAVFRPFRDVARKAGLNYCLEYMKAEDLQTNYIDIGPVNKALNMVSAFHAANNDINDQAVRNHMMRVPDYLWVAEDGMKMQGYNGSQCWDTSFAIQAVWECGLLDEFPLMSAKVWAYLERSQILSTDTSRSSPAHRYESCDYRDKFYRHVSKGGWPFSTSAHGWPISDCTGEGLKGVLALMDSRLVMGAVEKGLLKGIEPSRLHDAVNVILTLQNEDGGWATYENNRGFGWYEELNPSEVFGDIMIDYSYVECSMASLTALAEFHEKNPNHRTKEITFAMRRGAEFIKSIQREDGSWYGSWACCFCYGCWFGIEGLIKAGESHKSHAITKCCDFLLSQQRPNGGWGEDFTSCYDKDYAEKGMQSYGDEGSGVVNTAWALLALSAAKCSDVAAIRKGVQYLMTRQLECGDWPQEGISGVFNRACGITYTAYRNVFPIWALGRCSKLLGEDHSGIAVSGE